MKNINCLLLILIVACALVPGLAKDKPNPVAVSLEEYIHQAKANQPQFQSLEGSLYTGAGPNADLYSDFKARRINDLVTIRIEETTTAENTADSQTNRKSSTALAVPNFFGIENHNPSIPFDKLITANSDQSFKGDGSTKRTGVVSAYLSARVRDVLPNGDLVIEGIKEIKVNNERQLITLFGVVRPRDISPDNVVSSTVIANMMVQVEGKGLLSDSLKPGWLYQILTKIWPF